MTTKADIINDAYSQLRISGLTKQATPEDLVLALDRLENMAQEFEARNICVGYNFEDAPDINSLHNMERKFWYPYQICLATRLLTDFGKPIPPELFAAQKAAYSFLSSQTAPIRATPYPSRQPMGAKTRFCLQRFYSQEVTAPLGCATNIMYIGDVDNFTEHFDAWLDDGETISSFTIEADTGITINSSSNTDEDVTYNITATGTDGTTTDNLLQVKIVATTSASRIQTRIINFTLNSAEI